MSHVSNLMALSPYKSPQSPLNRSRSSSCSSPIRNRIVFQQIYSVGSNTLFRSYSCDQVFDKDANGQTFQTTQIQISSFITPEKKYRMAEKETATPVEGERKAPRKLNMETSEKSSKENIQIESTPKKSSKGIFIRTVKCSLLPVLIASLFYFYISYKECGNVWDLDKTENELREKVFGQSDALTKINSVFKLFNETNGVFTMIFTGGVGVGKTYSSSIISHNFPWSFNKLITFSESFSSDIEKLLKDELSTCGCNLVIVDDLTLKISSEALNLIRLVSNKRKSNEKILIILIFQIHNETERDLIIKVFKNSYFTFYHVPFKRLTRDVVEKCFSTEIQRYGVEISSIEFNKLVNDKMRYIDIVKDSTGCKGVAEEVSSYYKNTYNNS